MTTDDQITEVATSMELDLISDDGTTKTIKLHSPIQKRTMYMKVPSLKDSSDEQRQNMLERALYLASCEILEATNRIYEAGKMFRETV